jgi:hypothetical protein
MNDDIEARLRAALRPDAPDPGFTDRVMRRIGGNASGDGPVQSDARRRRVAGWYAAGIAAAILAAVGVRQHLEATHEREAGIAARRQVLEALQLTDRTLELAQRALKDQTPGA